MAIVYSIEERIAQYKEVIRSVSNDIILINNIIKQRDSMIAEGMTWPDISKVLQFKLDEIRDDISQQTILLYVLTWDYDEVLRVRHVLNHNHWGITESTKQIEAQNGLSVANDIGIDNVYSVGDTVRIENSHVTSVDTSDVIAGRDGTKITLTAILGSNNSVEYTNKTLTIRKVAT